jgi:hypothetical protein
MSVIPEVVIGNPVFQAVDARLRTSGMTGKKPHVDDSGFIGIGALISPSFKPLRAFMCKLSATIR